MKNINLFGKVMKILQRVSHRVENVIKEQRNIMMLLLYLVHNVSAHFIYLNGIGLSDTVLSLSALKGLLNGVNKNRKAKRIWLLIQIVNDANTAEKKNHCYVLEGLLVLIA